MKQFFLFSLMVIHISSFAQGQIDLEIRDKDSGRPIPGARVKISLQNNRTLFVSRGSSDNNGMVTLENVQEDKAYIVTVEKETYRAYEENRIFSKGTYIIELSSTVGIADGVEPADEISRENLEYVAHYSLGQLLQYMVPSFHSTPQTISDGTDHLAPASLRGLGPDQVLLLINGKRRHSSSLVNVNGTIGRGSVSTDYDAIPVSSIERIEIYRAGAATRFGSDAIAGVINVILREDEAISVGIQGGFTNGGSNKSEFYDFFGDGGRLLAYTGAGFRFGRGGTVRITGEYLHRGAINRSGNYTGPVYVAGDTLADQALQEVNDFYEQGPLEDLAGRRVMKIGQALTNDARIILNSNIPLYFGEKTTGQAYAIGHLNVRNGAASGFYRFPYQRERIASEILYPDGFLPTINSFIRDIYYVIGVRGQKGKWFFDFSNTQGSNTFDFNVANSNNASLGIQSPTSFYSGGFRYRQNTSQIEMNRDSVKITDGLVLNFRSGMAFRYEGYAIESGEEASYIQLDPNKPGGAQVFPGFRPSNEVFAQRTNSGVYAGADWVYKFDKNIKLFLSPFVRYESYSDFGDAITGKVAAKLDLRNWLKFRASFNQGFRAPSLHQSYFNSVSTQITSTGQQQVGTFNNQSVVARNFGIAPLEQERSEGYNVGLLGNNKKGNIWYYIDFYRINISNRIILSGQFDASRGGVPTAYFDILNPLGVSSAQFFTNAVGTSTQGLDFMFNYHSGNKKLLLDASIGGNFVLKNEVSRQDDGTVSTNLPGFDTPEARNTLFSEEEIARLETGQPDYKIIAQLLLEVDQGFFVKIQNTSFGKVAYKGRSRNLDQIFDARPFIADVELGWNFKGGMNGTKFSLSLGCHNIGNIYPEENIASNTEQGVFVYSRRVQQFGVAGRSFFARAKFDLVGNR